MAGRRSGRRYSGRAQFYYLLCSFLEKVSDTSYQHRDSTTAALSSELEPSQYDIRQVAGTESRGSVDIAFDDQQHTGAASGLAFLHEAVNIIEHRDSSSSARNKNGPTQSSISIFTSGMPNPSLHIYLTNSVSTNLRWRAICCWRSGKLKTAKYRNIQNPTIEVFWLCNTELQVLP